MATEWTVRSATKIYGLPSAVSTAQGFADMYDEPFAVIKVESEGIYEVEPAGRDYRVGEWGVIALMYPQQTGR